MDAAGPTAVATTCPYCGVGCGVLATPQPDGAVTIAGDPIHPANAGRLCSKGAALGETVDLKTRLLVPRIEGRRATWDAALSRVARAFSAAIQDHGPESVAFYVSGQLLTEDYYVANKLMKGFIGTANIDTNSRLCMASSVAGHKRAFGADTVPGTYEDLESADLLILVGSNLAWCHPVLFQRVMAAKEARPELTIIAIDPRATATTDAADLHLPLRPKSDLPLFAGLLTHLSAAGLTADEYVRDHTTGAENALSAAKPWTADKVAAETALPVSLIRRFYNLVEKTARTVTVYSQGINQSDLGSDTVNAIINTHLLTGRIGVKGAGPFSVTGQPNAMGGREVGGLANMLACHMDLENAAHRAIVQRHWDSPTVADRPGLKAVDLFDAVDDGKIKALWVMATNPADSMPEAERVDRALSKIPFLAVSDVVASNDTLRHATVALPAAAWGEKDGTVTNSERVISRQRAFLPAPNRVRPDWAIMSDVARRMGYHGFNYGAVHEIFDEYAQLSEADNQGTRDFDIGGLAGLSAADYDGLMPARWPMPRTGRPTTRFFAGGNFFTPDRRGRFIPTPYQTPTRRTGEHRLTLNTGRIRDQWHTMTRTGLAPTLALHYGEPFAEIHPDDARNNAIAPADIVSVSNEHGTILVRALVTERQRKGSIFVPIHFTDQVSANARVDKLVPGVVDPVSGQPASKFAQVSIAPAGMALYGYMVRKGQPHQPLADYFAVATLPEGTSTEFASAVLPQNPTRFAERLLGQSSLAAMEDRGRQTWSFAAIKDGRLTGAVYLATSPVAVARTAIAAHLGQPADVRAILAGRPPADRPDPGAIVCACFQVGANTIKAAIEAGADSVDAVGSALSAGTNCGSCRAEIARLIKHCHTPSETTSVDTPIHAPAH
ncbi:MAG: nitrate reductase [Pseudomonadota bacterium]